MRQSMLWHPVGDPRLEPRDERPGAIWTVSPDPERNGWVNDYACPGYGLTLREAEHLARCTRVFARVSELVDREKATRFHRRAQPVYAPLQQVLMDLEGLLSQ